jgi:hypothetical protein
MSFDLAVWEGARPRTNEDGAAEFAQLHANYIDGKPVKPTPRITAFVAAVTAKYPDLTDMPDDRVEDGVWADSPLMNNASGPYFYFCIRWSRAEEVSAFVAEVAKELGLVCFDPQSSELR